MATYNEIATLQLRNLSRAVGFEQHFHEYLAIQQVLLDPWGDAEIPIRAPYDSHIGDDHSPFEYSVAFEGPGAAELRLLVEAQGEEPGLVANQRAALALNRRLEKEFGIELQRFRAVADLFFPADPEPPFTLWHGVCLPRNKKPTFKAYFNPRVRGPHNARRLVEEALERLGFADAAQLLFRQAAWRPERDVPTYFSLDLTGSGSARVKVYHAHRHAKAEDLEALFRIAPTHRPGDVTEYCRTMAGHEGPFDKKPLTSCFAFVQGWKEPQAVTFHLPIAHYVADDHVAAGRVTAYLAAHGLPAQRYGSIVRAMASRPLVDGAGIQSYVSHRRHLDAHQVIVYLSTELFRGAWRRLADAPAAPERGASARTA